MAGPFFILGTPRSGTTLLSVLLENHSKLYIDGESVGISLAREFEAYKQILSRNPVQSRPDLLARICEGSYKGRLARMIRYKEIEKYPDLRSLLADSVHRFAAANGKEVWGDKTPELIFHLPQILELFPDARFIQVVRDARANASSLAARQYYPLELAAQYWKEINGLGIAYQSLLGPKQFHLVKYEDLLRRPEEAIRDICAFLQIPFEAKVLDLQASTSTGTDNAYVGDQIDASRIDSWKKKLSKRDILQIEKICGDLMQELGYSPEQLSDPTRARSLSYGRQFWLRQQMVWRLLFKRKRMQMIDRKLIAARIPFRQRLRNFIFGTTRQFFSEDFIRIFKSDFRR